MSAQYCAHCGAPMPAGSAFCAYCGTPAATAPAAPLSSLAPPPVPPAPSLAGAPSGRWGRRRLVLVVIVVVVVIVLAGLVYVATTAPVVTVTEINVYAPTDVCGLNEFPIYYAGFSDSPGASDAFGLQIENFNNTTCKLSEVTTNTTGFTLSDLGLPLFVPAVGNNTLNLTITLPGGAYNGPLDLVYS